MIILPKSNKNNNYNFEKVQSPFPCCQL
jgi:hypothetical protein